MPNNKPRAARPSKTKRISSRGSARPKKGTNLTVGGPVQATVAAGPQVLLVNIIPRSRSGEEHQDSEPSLAVNPNNPLHIAASAFTPDPNGGDRAPIYASVDGGKTWILNSIIPSIAGTDSGTGDITLRFGSADTLYAGILRFPGELRMNILRTKSFLGLEPMTVLLDTGGDQVDQPFIQTAQTATVVAGIGKAKDIVYVGSNRLGAPGGRTAAVDLSLDAAAVKAEFKSVFVDQRDPDPDGVDSPAIRPAVHPDGTVYVAFLHRLSLGNAADGFSLRRYDVVVVRDDAFGVSAKPFSALKDLEDQVAGIRVMQNRLIPWLSPGLGQERTGSDLAITIDPADSKRVFLAWADRVDKKDYTLHLRRSADLGETWSSHDLRTITNAINPALAVNDQGVIGFLFQQLVGNGAAERWVTHFQFSSDGINWNDLVLATVPAHEPHIDFFPYIGDYVSLMAVGHDFYGIFSANNTPDKKNFPCGVVYQRNADFTKQQLLDVDGTSPVHISIDPFFFKVTPP